MRVNVDSPPLDNQTDFETHPQLLLTSKGERLAVFIKATFELDPFGQETKLTNEERARSIRHADEPWDDPEVDSIRYPCDISPEKPGTDVVVVATAYAPGGAATPTFDSYVRVGPLSKAIRVHGLRVWEAGGAGVSVPRPLTQLDVRYDFAWGGRDNSVPGKTAEEPRNPVGRGIACDSAQLTHQLAPQLENIDEPIRTHRTRPMPAGLGVVGRSFSPRRDGAGTFDKAWEEFRCPLPPANQKPEFFQCASPGLVAIPHLVGGEACALLNLHPQGALQFALPKIHLGVSFDVKDRPTQRIVPTLNTVLIDAWVAREGHPALLELVWVATTPAPRKVLNSLTTVFERSPA